MTKNSNQHVVIPLAAATVVLTVVAITFCWKGTKGNKVVGIESDGKTGQDRIEIKNVTTTNTSNNEQLGNNAPISVIGGKDTQVLTEEDSSNNNDNNNRRILTKGCITIVHGSMTGTCTKFAKDLYDALQQQVQNNGSNKRSLQVGSVEDWDWWDELLNEENNDDNNNDNGRRNQSSDLPILVLFLSTHTNGTWPPCATNLENTLQDLLNDWRIEKQPLKNKLQVTIYGTGSSEYHDEYGNLTMGKPVKEAARLFQKLGVKFISKHRIGDDAVGNHVEETYQLWKDAFFNRLMKKSNNNINAAKTNSISNSDKSSTCCGNGSNIKATNSNTECCQKKSDNSHGDTSGECSDSGNDPEVEYESENDQKEPELIDLEDMGDAMMESQTNGSDSSEPREMVTPSQAKALQKEGYKLIGTHSAVKLCRWTKHQLRGRGGCYKHTFYGITSYQCMEATPSLACANKCVFCWRHHKNPVGKEWRWKTDDPHYIVDEAIKAHVKMIKEAKGIPGVHLDRWQQAHTVRHCALSLVGEPIMYPRIDEFLADLHNRKISTFLVTNGQHPTAIGSLRPVTQLYVSVDAPTQESLIAIDRPLFNDAWERLKQSLSSLKDKGQRTVARLTVVKGWNSDEVEGYAKLIALGKVSLVEVKGVTFCGKSDASNLNMSNTPWHHEVVDLTKTLKKEIDKMRQAGGIDIPPEYDLACEHKHSCSVLLARVDLFAEDDLLSGKRRWKTWIDYDKFHSLAAKHALDPSFSFSATDYTAETPLWAMFGAEEEGFDPTDQRHRKNTKHPMYTKFDEIGVPTHDHDGKPLNNEERQRLQTIMDEKMQQLGAGSTVTELKGGAKEIMDVSLMFRGLVMSK